jgi:predicted house-cleaning NTP pyrophosphatase (Maf/HAM1 superfamily)
MLNKFENYTVILASQSPQRREILEKLGIPFEIIPSTFPETIDKVSHSPEDYVLLTAQGKLTEIWNRIDHVNVFLVD